MVDIHQLRQELNNGINQLRMEYPNCEWLQSVDRTDEPTTLEASSHSRVHILLYLLCNLTKIGKSHNGHFN